MVDGGGKERVWMCTYKAYVCLGLVIHYAIRRQTEGRKAACFEVLQKEARLDFFCGGIC